MIEARFAPTYAGWRAEAERLLGARVAPAEIVWRADGDGQQTLAGLLGGSAPPAGRPIPLPAKLQPLAEAAACHSDPRRWALLYRIAHRMTGPDRRLLDDPLDRDAEALRALVRAVDRDVHHLHAFARFRAVTDDEGERHVAFHRPEHHVLERAVPFFVPRFGRARWSLLTPERSAHGDDGRVTFGPGVPRSTADADALDELWRTYYTAVFNPARANLRLTRRKIPDHFWPDLPEAPLIVPLAREAAPRAGRMTGREAAPSAAPLVPAGDLATVAAAAARCQACPLHAPATQTVFGEGPPDARLMLVGEQPGDEEDGAGRPFVGPAGAVLDAALAAAGLDRARLYVTNAVKHFKFVRRGKWRIHQRPRGREAHACAPWLMAEIARVRPEIIVALGATAAQTLFGAQVRLMRDRGRPLPSPHAPRCLVTYHPSAVLRAGSPVDAEPIEAALRADLALAAAWLAEAPAPAPR